MRTVVGWVVIVASAILIVALIADARGAAHHRGDDIGSLQSVRLSASVG
jgi:hypothetical protein